MNRISSEAQCLGAKHVDDFTAHARRRIVDTIRPQFDIHTTGYRIEWYNGTSRKTVFVSERMRGMLARALIISDDGMNVIG
jgi:hypothetical protein